MSSYIVRILSPQVALACAAVLALTACDRAAEKAAAPSELAWARAALERNPQIQVVATDEQSGVLTIRDKNTGEVQAVRLSELAAAPIARLNAAPVAGTVASSMETTLGPITARPIEESAPTAAPPPATSRQEPIASATPSTASSSDEKNYTIERTGGKLKVSGPGISIESSGVNASASAPAPAGQRTVDPIICEGPRMLHFDNRSIFVDGDAITVRGGCEIFITNSRIVASGTGIVVKDAIVHVSNSHIEGAFGSFDATDRSKLYVRDTTFQGVPRRTELAMVQDQGGNRWR